MQMPFKKREGSLSLSKQLFAEHLLYVRIAVNKDSIPACPQAAPRTNKKTTRCPKSSVGAVGTHPTTWASREGFIQKLTH